MTCPDCLQDGRGVSTVFDFKQMGQVCPRCERVFSPHMPTNNFHYATERGYRARIERDQKRQLFNSVSTTAMRDRIIKPMD